MKILLIQPPVRDFYDTDVRLQPIGLAFLKAVLAQHLPELTCKVMDFHHGCGRFTVPIPAELAYLKEYYPHADRSPFGLFHQYYHYGAPFEVIAEQVAAEQPDLVGISSLFTPYYREVLATAAAIKGRWDGPILVGGSHVSADPESILQDPSVDFVICGEGEKSLVGFLRHWSKNGFNKNFDVIDWSGIPNLGFKNSEKIILNEMGDNFPLEEIPPPDLSDFSLKDYCFEDQPLAFLVTSRSCPHRCTFCSVHSTFGTVFRRKTVDQVFAEICLRYDQGYRVLDFEDDNLTFYQEEMKELCRRIIARFPRQELTLVAMNGISYLSLDEGLLGLMKQAGFSRLNLSLVTSDTTVRESTKRPHTVEKFLTVVHSAHRLGMKITSYQILGLPEETLESMIQTMCFGARLPVLLGASPFYLTPNSPIAKKMGIEIDATGLLRSRLSALANETPFIKREELYTLFLSTRILNFLKSFPVKNKEEWDFAEVLSNGFPIAMDPRAQVGLKILRELFATEKLHAWTPQGMRVLSKFQSKLFFRIWNELGWVTTQAGGGVRCAHQRSLDIIGIG